MPTKLGRKEVPSKMDPASFKYQGRPAKDQDDFGSEVGIADMVCVNQFGDANNNKYYHAGVVSSAGKWFVYLEWGRVTGGKSWNGSFRGQDFQFVQCSTEAEARDFFQKQCRDKNVKRLEQKKVGSSTLWVGKAGKDGYVIQRLATRERGLPDAYLIKDDEGVAKKASAPEKKAQKKATPRKRVDAQPQVVALARALVGGTQDYARAAQQSTGIVPTMSAIEEVRDKLIPDALTLLAKIGPDQEAQLKDKRLQQLSTYVATIVPRPIPRNGDPSAVLLSQNNIFSIQQDLDAFEAALRNEDFDVEERKDDELDPCEVLNAEIEWIDQKNGLGKWVYDSYLSMTNNRHGHLRERWTVHNIFSVKRPRVDDLFVNEIRQVASLRKGNRLEKARLQPRSRPDTSDIGDWYGDANAFLAIHGTRSVNIAPIMQTNFRLPKALKGVHITGSAFGAGWYAATDRGKSAGYVSSPKALYSSSSGAIRGRGAFMFLCDAIMGKPYMAKSTMWSVPDCPAGHDSIAAYPEHTSVQNDEHVLFNVNRQRIRYLVEVSF
jgi:hypothetical protein